MAIYTFSPSTGATAGKTVKVTTAATVASVNGTLTCTNLLASAILVTNASTTLAFVRVSTEATPVATAADVPVLGGTSRVFANPLGIPSGNVGLAVLNGTAAAVDVYFTPGIGGI